MALWLEGSKFIDIFYLSSQGVSTSTEILGKKSTLPGGEKVMIKKSKTIKISKKGLIQFNAAGVIIAEFSTAVELEKVRNEMIQGIQ